MNEDLQVWPAKVAAGAGADGQARDVAVDGPGIVVVVVGRAWSVDFPTRQPFQLGQALRWLTAGGTRSG